MALIRTGNAGSDKPTWFGDFQYNAGVLILATFKNGTCSDYKYDTGFTATSEGLTCTVTASGGTAEVAFNKDVIVTIYNGTAVERRSVTAGTKVTASTRVSCAIELA